MTSAILISKGQPCPTSCGLKLGPFSSSSSSLGLGMRLVNPKLCMAAYQDAHEPSTFCTGVGSGGARGAAAPLNAGRRGLRPPTNWCEWVSETKYEIKQPAVVTVVWHRSASIESFFAPAPRRTATVAQGKLALPGSWHMPRMRLHDTWRRGLCRTYHHI